MRSRQYGQDVLATAAPRPGQRPLPRVAAEPGLVVEDSVGAFCGAVVSCEKDAVTLEDRHGRQRVFPLAEAFLLEGKRVMLARPAQPAGQAGPGRAAAARTASGSVPAPRQRAKVARASRIYVEGRHDAELVERILGGRPAGRRRRGGVPRRHR